jgi:hypothetical protein
MLLPSVPASRQAAGITSSAERNLLLSAAAAAGLGTDDGGGGSGWDELEAPALGLSPAVGAGAAEGGGIGGGGSTAEGGADDEAWIWQSDGMEDPAWPEAAGAAACAAGARPAAPGVEAVEDPEEDWAMGEQGFVVVSEVQGPAAQQQWADEQEQQQEQEQEQQQAAPCGAGGAGRGAPAAARAPLQTFNGMFVRRAYKDGHGRITSFFKSTRPADAPPQLAQAPQPLQQQPQARPLQWGQQQQALAAVHAVPQPARRLPPGPGAAGAGGSGAAGAGGSGAPAGPAAQLSPPLPRWFSSWQRLPGTNIIVDNFTQATRALPNRSWILSHFHADHYGAAARLGRGGRAPRPGRPRGHARRPDDARPHPRTHPPSATPPRRPDQGLQAGHNLLHARDGGARSAEDQGRRGGAAPGAAGPGVHGGRWAARVGRGCHGSGGPAPATPGACVDAREAARWPPATCNPTLTHPRRPPGTRITFLDANHCPGSAMIAAHPPGGAPPVLHTGDARLTREATRSCPVLGAMRGRAVLVLDTTYADPQVGGGTGIGGEAAGWAGARRPKLQAWQAERAGRTGIPHDRCPLPAAPRPPARPPRPQYCFPSQQEVVDSVIRAVKVAGGATAGWEAGQQCIQPHPTRRCQLAFSSRGPRAGLKTAPRLPNPRPHPRPCRRSPSTRARCSCLAPTPSARSASSCPRRRR